MGAWNDKPLLCGRLRRETGRSGGSFRRLRGVAPGLFLDLLAALAVQAGFVELLAVFLGVGAGEILENPAVAAPEITRHHVEFPLHLPGGRMVGVFPA